MPSEILLQIVKNTDPMGKACLSLTSKYLALHCLKAEATFPSKKGAYLDDTRRVTFLNLLKGWMPEKYRMCFICRIYRPINGGHLEEKYVHVRSIDHTPKISMNITRWKDEDWTFISLGKRISKSGTMETRTYCPACIKEVKTIKIGRRRMGMKRKNAAIAEELHVDADA